MSDLPIIEIIWVDAQHGTEITAIEEFDDVEPVNTASVGYLIKNHKDYVILGFTNFNNGYIKHYQLIPKGMIIKYKLLFGKLVGGKL